jgi:hypothetical protein
MKTLIILSLILMALAIIVFLIFEWGKRLAQQASLYDRIYNSIELSLKVDSLTTANYKATLKRLEWLSDLPYKDKERTDVLYRDFRKKYEELNQGCEFEPSAIFTGE